MDIGQRLEALKKRQDLHLYILTPCYGGQCFANYVSCLLQTKDLLDKTGISLTVEFLKNDSLVSRARNNLVAKAMGDATMTHILFIDGDISWNPLDVVKLLVSDKDIIGGIYPLKCYEWGRVLEPGFLDRAREKRGTVPALAELSDQDLVVAQLMRYNVNHLDTQVSIQDNLARVRHLPTGFMMIRRHVIDEMQKAHPETRFQNENGHYLQTEAQRANAYALFDCGVYDGRYLSEDWLFCHRWNKIGGEIWADVSICLTHSGNEDFRGNYAASLLG